MRVLLILEVSRKQDYIFSTKRLRENAQRSADISYVTSKEFFTEAAAGLFDEEKNFIYAGGGHTVLQFDGREQAKAFAQAVTETVLRRWKGLELFVKISPYEEAMTPGENLKELSKGLERKKALRKTSFKQADMGMELLDSRDLPAPAEGGAKQPRLSCFPAARAGRLGIPFPAGGTGR